jgi:hypothetical protein
MEVLLGKSSVNGPFSIAMLNYQRVSVHIRPIPWPPGHPLAKNCVEISGLLGLWNWHFNRPGRRAFSKEGLGVTGTGLAAYRCMICMCWLLLSDSFRCFRAVRFAVNLRKDATSGSFGLPRGFQKPWRKMNAWSSHYCVWFVCVIEMVMWCNMISVNLLCCGATGGRCWGPSAALEVCNYIFKVFQSFDCPRPTKIRSSEIASN